MNRLLLQLSILIFFCNITASLGQSKNQSDTFTYQLSEKTTVYRSDFLGSQPKPPIALLAPKGAIFNVIDFTSNNDAIVEFWQWKDDPMKSSFNINSDKKLYFVIPKVSFDLKALPYFTGQQPSIFSVSAMTVPIKIRMSPNLDFQSNISIGAMFGTKYRLSHKNPYYLNTTFGLALSSVPLDSASTNGKIKTGERPALSPILGFIFDFGTTNLGLYFGTDLLSKKNREDWIYHGMPWIGFGIGISLTGKSTNSSKEGTNTVKSD